MTITGRGAWTHIGGTTPYYELHRPRIGVEVLNDNSVDPAANDYRAVNYGVTAIQLRLSEIGFVVEATGKFGWKTKRMVKKFQSSVHLESDGVVGPTTVRELFRAPIVAAEVTYGVPAHILWGAITIESGFDPGAVGYYTPDDKGFLQFRCGQGYTTWWNKVPTTYTVADAFSYRWAFTEGAKRFAAANKKYRGKGTPLRLNCVAAQHNSPAWADEWFSTGKAPNAQIETYARKVLAAGQNF